jgi:hypothetical protein
MKLFPDFFSALFFLKKSLLKKADFSTALLKNSERP